MGKEYNWATPSMKEFPFWRDDMSPEEFAIERKYYYENYESLVKTGKYAPLWKQK